MRSFVRANRAHHTASGVYEVPGLGDTGALNFLRGGTDEEVSDAGGSPVGIRIRSVDFVIERKLLVIGGTEVRPQPGHRIKITEKDGSTSIYDVANRGREPCFREHDTAGEDLRIHTKEAD